MNKPIILLITTLCLLNVKIFAQSEVLKKGMNNDRSIQIDYNKVKGQLNTMFKECIGAGRANEGLRADWQQQLALAKKDCGFKYIRFHGLLVDDMGVYGINDKGEPQYNFQYIDALFDFFGNRDETFCRDRIYAQCFSWEEKGSVTIKVENLPKGKYELQVFKVGYKTNDAYTMYINMGKPNQLTREQVKTLKDEANGAPILIETINVKSNEIFNKILNINENDVLFLSLKKV